MSYLDNKTLDPDYMLEEEAGFNTTSDVEVFKEVGPEIETEALEMLQDQTLLKILAFAGREELESRVMQVLVEREEMLLALETDVEVKREAREAVARRFEQTMADSKATDQRIYGLKMEHFIRTYKWN